LRLEGYKNAEISLITGYSKSRISALVCIYANEGIDYFKNSNYKGGNNRNLSFEEEVELLKQFEEKANSGQIITVQEIENAYEEKVGHEIGSGQIYKVLKRHGWRKVMPRSQHPNKASEEAIEASKKLALE
jgi:transposase